MPFLDANARFADPEGLEFLSDILATKGTAGSDEDFRAAFDPSGFGFESVAVKRRFGTDMRGKGSLAESCA